MTETTPETQSQANQGFDVAKVARRAAFAFVGFIVLLVVLIVVLSLIAEGNDAAQVGVVVAIIRDVVIILLALEGILIVMALVVLIAQVARLVNLLQNEVKPILENTQETVRHAKGSVEFVGKNVTEPVISTSAFFAGLGVIVRELGGIRRALRPEQEQVTENDA